MGQLIAGPGTLAGVVKKLPKKAPLTAAIAFVSEPMGLPVKAGDRIYVNCLDSTIAGGATDPRLLAKWVKAGVEVLHCPELHAKVIVAGNWAAIGSANLSNRADRVQEAVWVGNDAETREQAQVFLDSLAKVSVQVNAAWLKAKADLFGTARTGSSGPRTRAPHERRPYSVLPVKVTKVHLAYGRTFPEDLPAYVRAVERAAGPNARFQGVGGYWPSADRLDVGDLVVWVEAPVGVRKGEPTADVGVMDAPLLVTARPQRAGKASNWFVAEFDTYLDDGVPVPALTKAQREALWEHASVTLTSPRDIDKVLASWGLSSKAVAARTADAEATLPF